MSLVVLKVYNSEGLVEVKQFDGLDQIVVGTSDGNQLCLPGSQISPIHCVIEKRQDAYFLTDMGSGSGSFVNGEKQVEKELGSGDTIQVGNFRLHFFVGVPPAEASEPHADVSAVGLPKEAPKFEEPKKDEASEEVYIPEPEGMEESAPAPQPVIPQQVEEDLPPMKDYLSEIRPEQGTTLEVIIAWEDRIIATEHFNEPGKIHIGSSEDCEIMVPVFNKTIDKYKLIEFNTQTKIYLNQGFRGKHYIKGQKDSDLSRFFMPGGSEQRGPYSVVTLDQNEMIRLDFAAERISIFIRYVPESARPLAAPLLDLSATEITAVILAFLVSGLFGLYMLVYSPEPLAEDEANLEEPFRRAIVKFDPPPRKKQVVRVSDVTSQKSTKTKNAKKKAAVAKTTVKKKPGRASSLKRRKNAKKSSNPSSIRKKGGAKKTSTKKSASATTVRKDPKKVGMLGILGARGVRNQLDQAAEGSGELIGEADKRTGTTGQNENRAGGGIGSRLKNTGAGGSGSASVGISGVGTKGRGTGTYGLGSGGLGEKGNVDINVGGSEEAFIGSIDREAIRRVIRANIRQIRACYERELNRNPNLSGKLVLEWDIIERGKAINTKVKSNGLRNRNVANCVMRRLRTWRFPEPPEDQIARVTYPFVFSSK